MRSRPSPRLLAAAFVLLAPLTAPRGLGAPAGPPALGENLRAFEKAAAREYGELGRRAAEFLAASMPADDRANLSADFLLANLRLAFAARQRFPWTKDVPEERFFNDVLPYAVLDETREDWRPAMLARAEKIVASSRTIGEAAQALNCDLFNQLKVHYNPARRRPNQAPSESIAQGRATCTGLSILLVDACRAVGIPARVAGIAEWTTKPGNHTWVEVWDGGEWKFLGADEYDARGLNRGWFVEDASKAVATEPEHAIWARSWKPVDGHFPLAWAPDDHSLGAENVTARYAGRATPPPAGLAPLHLRVIDSSRPGPDQRILVTAELRDEKGTVISSQPTPAGTADLNDMANFAVAPGRYRWRFARDGEVRESPLTVDAPAEQIVEIDWQKLPASTAPAGLTRAQAEAAVTRTWTERQRAEQTARESELAAKSLSLAGKTLRWAERTDGPRPRGGYPLWISLHGGGGTTAEVNDGQFKNQINLYPPTNGIWVVPRAPTDAWDMWHQPHIDPMFVRVIEDYVLTGRADPDRVYLLGYSAGGDGVYQLAPRMADRFAAAAMMAGHPNDASPLGLRNLPFAIFVGGDDDAYHRNEIAAEWGRRLDALHEKDPAGYVHWTRIYPGLGHWMNHRDAEAIPWLAKFTRDPWPKKVVWRQDDVVHDQFYWLTVPADSARPGQTVTAEVDGQTIRISADGLNELELALSDALLDLDRPVTVLVNGQPLFRGVVPRTARAIAASLDRRADPRAAATATLSLQWKAPAPKD